MRVIPPIAERKTGTVLICGPAPSLFADFQAARAAFPDAELMALSWAIRAVRAQHLFSHHYELAHVFRGTAAHDWPEHRFLIHSQMPRAGGPVFSAWPDVDHFHEIAWDAANSAPAACLVALESLGFARVVLCGIALDGTEGYAVQTGLDVFWRGEQAVHGGMLGMADFTRRENLDRLAGRVFAMSGAPRALFGLPPELRA